MAVEKQRIIQEYVPGKQVTLAHLIAKPAPGLYKKLGAVDVDSGALGVMTITPGEGAVIAADIASKAARVNLVFVDRFSGSLLLNGDVSSVETALRDIIQVLERTLGFTPSVITKT
ncbi:MAG: BMC domain-containing protein [Treponema sp.]|nr:BMC domain-containing protein [Treponema sp.]